MALFKQIVVWMCVELGNEVQDEIEARQWSVPAVFMDNVSTGLTECIPLIQLRTSSGKARAGHMVAQV